MLNKHVQFMFYYVFFFHSTIRFPHNHSIIANDKLMDYAVGAINTMDYDNSGGAFFFTIAFIQSVEDIESLR